MTTAHAADAIEGRRGAPLHPTFLVVMASAGAGTARVFRPGAEDSRAVVFSRAARNRPAAFPFALALPGALPVAVAVVVTQTPVEVVGTVPCIRFVPRVARQRKTIAHAFAR